MKAIKASLDDLTYEVREGFKQIKSADDLLETKYVTRVEFESLRVAHRSLTQKLWVFVSAALLAILYAIFRQVGLN